MDHVMVIVTPMWAGRSGRSTRQGAYSPADRRTAAGSAAASGDRSDHGPSARTDQAAAQRALCGIVRVSYRGTRQYEPSPD